MGICIPTAALGLHVPQKAGDAKEKCISLLMIPGSLRENISWAPLVYISIFMAMWYEKALWLSWVHFLSINQGIRCWHSQIREGKLLNKKGQTEQPHTPEKVNTTLLN